MNVTQNIITTYLLFYIIGGPSLLMDHSGLALTVTSHFTIILYISRFNFKLTAAPLGDGHTAIMASRLKLDKTFLSFPTVKRIFKSTTRPVEMVV